MPRPTADRSDHAVLVRTLRITIRRMLVVLLVIPVGDPLSGITDHILHSVGRVAIGQGPDRTQCFLLIPFTVKVRLLRCRWFITPGIETTISAASGLLPFRLR